MTPLIGLISLWLAVAAVASETITQHVYVKIASSDSTIESGLLKRLREFKDVEIQGHIEDAEDDFYITVMPIETDRLLGYAISVVYAEAFPLYGNIVPLEATVGSGSSLQSLRDFLIQDRKGRTEYRNSHLYMCGRKDLSDTLDQIIADINVEVFEPVRKAYAAHH